MSIRSILHRSTRSAGRRRRGTILVVTAIVLVALIGLLGLVIDAGMLMTAHRQTQNAADAAAAAAAMDMLTGHSDATARATAATFVQEHNVLPTATVTTNIPPQSGAHLGNRDFAEVIVSYPVPSRFIQALGAASTRNVTARAVAGWEGVAVPAGVIALDVDARPGINLSGNGSLKVNGAVVVNSNGGGLDQYGQPIGNGGSGNAITTAGNGALYANDVQSVGGVNDLAKIQNIDGSGVSPLETGTMAQPDPYQFLSPPTTSTGAESTHYGAVKLSGSNSVTLSPGVYSSIEVSANVAVTMNPGIYIIAGGGLKMTGNSTLSGAGVMIYNTGSDYNVATGLPDSGDGSSLASAAGGTTFGAVSITGNAALNLTPYDNPSSPFDGFVLYQRRINTQPLKLAGNASSDVLSGTVYAKWAPLDLSGNGTFNAQFVVRSLDLSGNGTLTLDVTGQPTAKSDQVYLVE